ncbi:MAG: hypothetical protein K6C36_01125 [Clostridia bacterium]|nr:hypothetical protein [Clostridia bacterium]
MDEAMSQVSKTLGGIDLSSIIDFFRKLLETMRDLLAQINIVVFPDK